MGQLQLVGPDGDPVLRRRLAAVDPSKLHPPRRRPDQVARPRLVKRIQDGLWRPLTLVIAPAGSGKTTLVAQWMEDCGRPVVWLSLDAADADPLRFLGHLLAALRPVRPEVGTGLDGIAPPSELSDLIPLLTETLIVPLAERDEPLALVLDDFHAVVSPVVDHAVAWLLDHLPPSMHVLITTRKEPALPLPTLRARDQLTEIRRADLGFDSAETRSFFADALQLDLDAGTLDRLRQTTEGWAAGLQLLGMSIARGAAIDEVLEGSSEDSPIGEFLVGEVLDRISPAEQEFLVRCSVLDELEGDLCAAVTGTGDAAQLLRELDRAGLFLIALDHRRRRFRFHHIFGELLKARLEQRQPGLSATLHRRAVRWYAAQCDPRRAAAHAIRAGDHELLAELVDRWGFVLLDASDRKTIEAWLALLPDDAAERWPGVGTLRGWLAVLPLRMAPDRALATGAVRSARAVLAAADTPEPAHWADFRAQLTVIESVATRPLDDPSAAIAHAQRTLDELPETAKRARAVLALQIGITHLMTGHPRRALAPLQDAEVWGRACGNVFAAIAGMGYRAGCLTSLGRPREAEALCDAAIAFAEEQSCGLLGATAYVHGQLARARFERWDLPGALDALEHGLLRARMLDDPFPLVSMLALLARAHQASGDEDLADEAAREALAIARSARIPLLETWADSCRQALDVQRGRARAELPDPASYRAVTHDTALVAVRAALAGGHLPDAVEVVEAHRRAAESAGRVTHVVDWQVEAILALDLAGEQARAVEGLEALLLTVAPDELWRSVAERLEPLTKQVSPAARSALERAGLLAARRVPPRAPRAPREDLPPLPEPPSPRELEVLALVSKGLSNPEIGRALFVSTGTVKTHMHRMLGKLGVRNRVEAVRVAQARGLVD